MSVLSLCSSGSTGSGWTSWWTTGCPPRMGSFSLCTRRKATSSGARCWRRPTPSTGAKQEAALLGVQNLTVHVVAMLDTMHFTYMQPPFHPLFTVPSRSIKGIANCWVQGALLLVPRVTLMITWTERYYIINPSFCTANAYRWRWLLI